MYNFHTFHTFPFTLLVTHVWYQYIFQHENVYRFEIKDIETRCFTNTISSIKSKQFSHLCDMENVFLKLLLFFLYFLRLIVLFSIVKVCRNGKVWNLLFIFYNNIIHATLSSLLWIGDNSGFKWDFMWNKVSWTLVDIHWNIILRK